MLATRVKNGAVLPALLAIIACTDSTGLDAPNVELRTEAAYTLSTLDSRYHEVSLTYAIRNLGPGSVFLPANCLDVYELVAEVFDEGAWKSSQVSYYGMVYADCLRSEGDIEIPEGGELTGQLDLLSLPDTPAEALYGAYRLKLPGLRDQSGANVGPVGSGVFLVGRPDGG